MSDRTVHNYDRRIVGYGTSRGWEHRQEREEFIEQDIPPELVALWRKTKTMFRGTPNQRREQFMEYVQENPDEAMNVLQEDADRVLDQWARRNRRDVARQWQEMQRAQEEQRKALERAQKEEERRLLDQLEKDRQNFLHDHPQMEDVIPF